MQINYGFGPSALRCSTGASKPASLLTPVKHGQRTNHPMTISCRAVPQKEQGKRFSLPGSPKLNAFLIAALPLITALPAGASEIQHYLQLATPGLAVVIGSLAYAAAAPPAIRRNLFKTSKTFDNVSLDEILQTEYHPCPGASPVLSTLEELRDHGPPETPVLDPVPLLITATPFSSSDELAISSTDEAEVQQLAQQIAVPLLAVGAEEAQNHGHSLSVAFADQNGHFGSLSNGASNGLENGTVSKEEAVKDGSPAEKAKELVSYVMEWTGLDARESNKRAQSENNVVPLHKSDGPARELVSVATEASQGDSNGTNGPDGELATVAMVATVPTSAVAALTESSGKSNTQRQEEHREKIESLMSQAASIKAVAVSPSTSTTPEASQQKEYETKVSALKQSATHKQKQEETRWQQQMASMENKMTQATKDRLQAVQPYQSLAANNRPHGLAKLHPKAIIASLMESMMAMWRIVVRTAKKFVGQDPPSPQMQT